MGRALSYLVESMSILDVTEDKIFQVLGKGKDPDYKPIKKDELKKTAEPFDFSHLLK